jgi:hypothetical protein
MSNSLPLILTLRHLLKFCFLFFKPRDNYPDTGGYYRKSSNLFTNGNTKDAKGFRDSPNPDSGRVKIKIYYLLDKEQPPDSFAVGLTLFKQALG